MMNVVMLIDALMSVIMLNVVLMSVVAPLRVLGHFVNLPFRQTLHKTFMTNIIKLLRP